MKLIIVESPHKSSTIAKFLPSEYTVLASKGHIRDLASTGKMGLGVDIDNDFKPTYVISEGKKDVVTTLKKAVSKADEVYLATDPDREGEAISWHLAKVLNLDTDKTKRLEFHEITKKAILHSLENPRVIDMNLVRSQETRRIIDRLMGYRLSYLLQSKIKSKSAGRVQSVVLKLIVDREKSIKDFKPAEYWTIEGSFKNLDRTLQASLVSYRGDNIKIENEKQADEILSSLPDSFVISSIKNTSKMRNPNPPFITSTLQQEAYSLYHFSPSKTSSVAQKLYEGKDIGGLSTGLITYMRTDSVRLSDDFVSSCKDYIKKEYGEQYIGNTSFQSGGKNVQDAHEAIRPTDISLTPDKIKKYLSKDEYQLYSLIFDRALSSLMSSRRDELTTVILSGNDYCFQTSSSKTCFDGFYKVYGKYMDAEEKKVLPELRENEIFTVSEMNKNQHFTKPPLHYTEGKVVKLMQENGIGRPSTYAPTISTLLSHEYLENQKGSLIPTSQGELTVDKLVEFFPKYMSEKYTSDMENILDEIAAGNADGLSVLREFWDGFISLYNVAYSTMEKVAPVEVGRNCPNCGSPLVIRKSKYGDFVACSNYPKCKYVEKEEKKIEILEGKKCPRCGGDLVKRHSKKGSFYGCINYPKCNYMEGTDGKEILVSKKETVIPDDAPVCPKCGKGKLVEKTSRFGKKFIACSNYPKCRYIVKEDKKKE